MDLKITNGICPYCRKQIFNYNASEWKYGSPIRTCKKCKNRYIDMRYHEIAVEGIEPGALSLKKQKVGMLLGLCLALFCFGYTFITLHFWGYYYRSMIVCGSLAVVIIISLIVEYFRIKTGAKERRLMNLKAESVGRLQNKQYAKELELIGYDVPKEYLG